MTRRDLAGARVLVTGASGGLGGAAAAALRAAGADVVGLDLRAADGVLAADVTDPAGVAAAVGDAVGRLGGLDILVNNAGIGWAQRSGPAPDADARRMIEVNLFGAWNTTAAALPELLRNRGHVVNVASGIAVLSLPFGAAYSIGKRALTAYSDVLRIEYRGRLTVTTLYPGYLETGIHDRNVAQGYSVGGILVVDPLPVAAASVVRACRRRPRSAYTSRTTAVALRAARVWPTPFELALRRRLLRDMAAKPLPDFLKDAGADR
jgi:NAD(P)-dependent dehydrogenase (short-subunit alcohol dehydrogenase family)